MQKKNISLFIGLGLFVQMIVVRILAQYPDFIESAYSNGLYPIVSKAFRYMFGWLPFSFGDIMYVVLIIMAVREVFLLFKNRFKNWKSFATHTLATASIVYFAFHFLWGMNYYRQPLHHSLGIDKDYTTQELIGLTEKLIDKSNALHEQLAVSDTVAVAVLTRKDGEGEYNTFAKADVYKTTLNGYKNLKTQFPKLNYPPKSIKTSLLSYPLSIMGYSGYLNPITGESQVNGLVPHHRIAVISCHEQAHQLGFAKENEANFVAVLATLNNEDLYFQYSGSIFALRYCLNDLYRRDKALGEKMRATLRPGIIENYKESRAFWEKMNNPLEPFFKLFYTNYLKANNQPGGLESYSYMVALLVNYNKAFPTSI